MVKGQEQNRIISGSFPARTKCNEYSFLASRHCLESDKRETLGWIAHFPFPFLSLSRNSLERTKCRRLWLHHSTIHRIRDDLGLCSGTFISIVNNIVSRLQRAENYFQQKIKQNNLMLSFPLISHYFLINMC